LEYVGTCRSRLITLLEIRFKTVLIFIGVVTLLFGSVVLVHKSHALDFILGDGGVADAVAEAEKNAETKHQFLVAQVS